MRVPTAEEITNLCNKRSAELTAPDGSLQIPAHNKFELLANNVPFHGLGHDALCAAVIGLSKVLLHPGLNSVTDEDHYALWSWCGELLLVNKDDLFPASQWEIKSLYSTCFHAALAECGEGSTTYVKDKSPRHARRLVENAGLVLAYLAFPLLEAVLKRACEEYIAFDGQVIKKFSITGGNGRKRKYYPNNRCSSLRDLLLLHSTIVAKPKLKILLGKFREHLSMLDGQKDPFDLIYGWRNDSLHGSTNFRTIGGVLLNLSILISIFEIEEKFDEHRMSTYMRCNLITYDFGEHDFYPPY